MIDFLKKKLGPNSLSRKQNRSMEMSGYIKNFTLGSFDQFVESTKVSQRLALEAFLAFDKFLDTMNSFLSTIEDIDEDQDLYEESKVMWYKICRTATGQKSTSPCSSI